MTNCGCTLKRRSLCRPNVCRSGQQLTRPFITDMLPDQSSPGARSIVAILQCMVRSAADVSRGLAFFGLFEK